MHVPATPTCTKKRHPFSIGQIFRDLGLEFPLRAGLGLQKTKIFRRISLCRTPAMGGALWSCGQCGKSIEVYHSCRDRHCPTCQAQKRWDWVNAKLKEVLSVPYYHVVFTLPHLLNPLLKANPKPCIGLLFQAASKTLLSFAKDAKYLGAEPGILMVLHTWGRKLNYHVHVHCIVTAGGLTKTHAWKQAPHKRWLFPVKAMSGVFRGKYLDGLDKVRQDLFTPNEDQHWNQFKRALAREPFVCYAKHPFGGPEVVLKYLGRYTHRVAIANQRLTSYSKQDNQVAFRYKDHRDHRTKTVKATPERFAKAFLQHVLPKGFMRIRSYGILANCKKAKSLARCRELLGEAQVDPASLNQTEALIKETPAEEPVRLLICPYCHKPSMAKVRELPKYFSLANTTFWDTS